MTNERPGLALLKKILAQKQQPSPPIEGAVAAPSEPKRAEWGGIKSSKTPNSAAIGWRVAALLTRIPAHGPIWPPRVRDTAACDTPGHCHLCGDMLDAHQRYRCAPCVAAMEIAISCVRERMCLPEEDAQQEQGEA